MILESIQLHNFRSYRGKHDIDLRPASKQQPVILFTGLNGAGKTSLLEALYLALYGKLTPSSRREGAPYHEYLEGCIHRLEDPENGASVSVELSRRAAGGDETYTVQRSWRRTGKSIKEHFEVLRNGRPAPVLGEEWAQFIEELLPSRLAPLFFFDGEQIEALADLEATTSVLSVAIHSLLGLHLVDQLASDLEVLERRFGRELTSAPEQDRLRSLERLVETAKAEEKALYEQKARLEGERARAEKCLKEAEAAFAAEGGEAFEMRHELEKVRTERHRSMMEAQQVLLTLAAGSAPLILLRPLLERTYRQSLDEARAAMYEELDSVLERRDAALIDHLSARGAHGDLLGEVRSFLENERKLVSSERSEEPYLRLSPEGRHRLGFFLDGSLEHLRKEVADGIERYVVERDHRDAAERRLAAVPEEGAIRELRKARDKARLGVEDLARRVRDLELSFEVACRNSEARRAELSKEMDRRVAGDFQREDAARLIEHSGKVRATLSQLRERVLERHLERIAHLVLDGFRLLVRKEHLVKDLTIDIEDFSLQLWGPDGLPVDPGKLSAGERQLLAVGLLWGLARAAGRPIPTLIDTPLGRLDSTHRGHLVERYFPHASHQVILLSTDEEIRDGYLDRLRASIGRSYVLEFDDEAGATSVREGWLEN